MLPNKVHSFDFAFTQATNGMALISFDGKLLKWNPALSNLWGYEPNGLNSAAQLSPAIHEQIHDIIQFGKRIQSKGIDQAQFEHDYNHPSGNRLSLDISISVIRDDLGAPLYYFTQFDNKTRMKQMETDLQSMKSSLHEKEESFLQLFECLPLPVLITKHGVIQYTNPAGLRLVHAASLDTVLGLATDHIVDASNHSILSERRKKYYNNKTTGSVCYLINCLNGQQKYVSGYSLPIRYHGERAIVGVFKDISEEMLEEERLMQSEKLSTAGQLAAGIAHEIRNPLTAINGFMKLLRSSERRNDNYFNIIESELKRIEFIVNELLVLSKPQTAHICKPMDFSLVLEQVITFMSGQAAMKNIEIIPVHSGQPIWIQGEANQLKQVFINLLKNAIEAMNSGGVIHIHALANDNEARIIVQDEGCGMTEEQIKALGKPFYTTKETGTGLGFMITHNIVHNHGGAITIESIPEQGTSFTVTIPTILEPEKADHHL